MNTSTLRSALSILFAATAIVAALPAPAMAGKSCPLRACGGADGEDPNGISRTGLALQRSTAPTSGFAIQTAVLPEPVVSIRTCPYRNCGGAEEEPNGSARTGTALPGALPQAAGFAIGRVVLPYSPR